MDFYRQLNLNPNPIMKKNLKRIATGIFTFLLSGISLLAFPQATITLLHVNDSHSHLDAVGPKDAALEGTLGGIARAATVFNATRAEEQNVLLLHAGDLFQGDPMFNTYFGVPELMLLQQLGFDAMAVGNHEFDFGPGVLNDVLNTAYAGGGVPLLSANLDLSGFPSLGQFITPSVMKQVGGVNIGIFGMTVPNNPTNMPDPVVVREDVVAIAGQAAAQLRSNGADVVIMLSHLGIYYDEQVVEGTSGIDLVIGGHDHLVFETPRTVLNADGRPVPVCQAGEHYEYVGKLRFTVGAAGITVQDYRMIHVDETVPPDPAVYAMVEQMKQGVSAQFGDLYHTVIGYARSDLYKHYDTSVPLRDTPIGSLVADAFRDKTGTEIAITPLGLISERIYKGPITGADVFRSMSYGFDPATGMGLQLATFDMSGMELVHGLEIGLSQLGITDDYFLQLSGVRFRYNPDRPVGERVLLSSIRVNGKKLDPTRMYSVTVNTGVVMLLDRLGIQVDNLRFLPDFEFEVVRDYIARLETINYHAEGRILEMHGAERLAEDEETSEAAQLSAYPNPASGWSQFQFTLEEDGPVELVLSDATGREAAVIAHETLAAGPHTIRWENPGLSSGLYTCTLRTSRVQQHRQLVIAR
jgi:5'-nucleotidase/UDP-sugar diphosphatase